jgi:hypothetical protein
MIMGASLVAAPAYAQSTTSTVLSGDAFGFQVMNSTTPDAFSFTSQSNVEPNGIDVISNIITISGITESVTASVSDLGTGGVPKISVNGAIYTTSPVQVNDGDSLRVSILPDTNVFSATYQAEVSIGGGSATFQVTTRAADTTPDNFVNYASLTNQEPSTVIASGDQTITGLEAPASVSVSGDGSPQISLDGGLTWVASGNVANNGTVAVRLTSGTFGETRTATVSVGGVDGTFSVTTRSSNDNPVFADFTDELSAEPGVTVTSDAVTVTGIETTVTASVSGDGLPEIQVNGGAWTPAGNNVTVANNDTIAVRLTSGTFGETRTATADVNGVTQDFAVTTRAGDTTPDAFTIAAVTDAAPNSLEQSSTTINGIETAATVTIAGEGAPEFSTDGGSTWVDTNGSGTVANGGTVLVRLTSSSGFEAERTATLTVGGLTGTFSVTTEAQDTTPDAFAFISTLAVADSLTASDVVTLSGFTGSLAISVSGDGSPEYRINGGAWTSAAGTVSSGQDVQVRLTAATTEGSTRVATLSVGTGSGDFSVETQDRTPLSFAFASVTDAELSTLTASASETVSGITGSVPISVEDAFSAEYQINGGGWTSASGTVTDGDTVAVRLVSANAYETARDVELTIGTVTESFSVTTRAQDTTPDAFAFATNLRAPGTADVVSETVTLAGYEGSVAISVSGDASAEYRIGTDAGSVTWEDWTSDAGTVSVGQLVQVRLDASASEGGSVSATLQVGTGSATYQVDSQDLTPDAFAFSAVTGASLSTVTTSDAVQITGISGDVPVSVSAGNGALFRVGTGPDAGNITWGPAGFVDSTETTLTVTNEGWVQMRLTSSASYETELTGALTIGNGTPVSFSVTTGAEPVTVTLSSGTVPDGEQDTAYGGFDFTTLASVSGGPAGSPPTVNDLSWSVTGGALPAGMFLSSAGDLTGTPTEIGSFSFTVEAELSGQTDSASYTIIVNDPDGSLVVEGG